MYHKPSDLAEAVLSALDRSATRPPAGAIHRLFEVMYFSSLRTEEGQHVAFHLVYLDPESPDPRPPKRIRRDRWRCARLTERVPFTAASMIKIARASDPRSSSFAVFHDGNLEVFVWGLIDQGNSYYDFITHNSESGPERPGLFQASITGLGHVTVFRGYQMIADLHVNELRPPALDALARGPVHDSLAPGIRRFIDEVFSEVGLEFNEPGLDWELADRWLSFATMISSGER